MYTFYICNTDYDWILFLVKLMLYRVARFLVFHVLQIVVCSFVFFLFWLLCCLPFGLHISELGLVEYC